MKRIKKELCPICNKIRYQENLGQYQWWNFHNYNGHYGLHCPKCAEKVFEENKKLERFKKAQLCKAVKVEGLVHANS